MQLFKIQWEDDKEHSYMCAECIGDTAIYLYTEGRSAKAKQTPIKGDHACPDCCLDMWGEEPLSNMTKEEGYKYLYSQFEKE